MNTLPDTRNSLILRLSDQRDIEAWDEFVAIYRPLVYRLARAKGLQDADALEVVQDTFSAVNRAIETWQPDPQKGRFRDWLFRIARNLVVNYLTRRKHRAWSAGGSGVMQAIEQLPNSADEEATFDLEFRREVYRWSADRVRRQVKPHTWQAFERTYLDDEPIATVAQQLGMSIGAVHIARSRVMGRLRETAKRFDADQATGEKR